jgi:hypothetical protein
VLWDLSDPFEAWDGPIHDHRGDALFVAGGDWFTKKPPQNGKPIFPLAMDNMRDRFRYLVDTTPNLDWLLLTKRADNLQEMWWRDHDGLIFKHNVWLMYSASDQQTLDGAMPHFLPCHYLVPIMGVSLEPLLGPIDLTGYLYPTSPGAKDCLRWVIVGGESGPKARPCRVSWIRGIVAQCQAAGVPCFVKQLGAVILDERLTSATHVEDHECWPDGAVPIHDRILLKHRKGGNPSEWPMDLRVRQIPGEEVTYG